jgi:hypothetical protein
VKDQAAAVRGWGCARRGRGRRNARELIGKLAGQDHEAALGLDRGHQRPPRRQGATMKRR